MGAGGRGCSRGGWPALCEDDWDCEGGVCGLCCDGPEIVEGGT